MVASEYEGSVRHSKKIVKPVRGGGGNPFFSTVERPPHVFIRLYDWWASQYKVYFVIISRASFNSGIRKESQGEGEHPDLEEDPELEKEEKLDWFF